MSCLTITVYLLVLIAMPLGFIGLVVLINGFVNKVSQKINLGTILISIALVMLITGCFLISKRCINAMKNYECCEKMSDHSRMFGHKCAHLYDFGKTTTESDTLVVE